jgi:sporulation protein YlmC with PRC-barrel domain
MRKIIFLALVGTALCGAPPCLANPQSAAQAQQSPLVGLPIYSSDKQKVGEVTSVDVDAGGKVTGLKAEIKGFLGMSSGTVGMSADEFKQEKDRIVISKTADQVRGIPGADYAPQH